MLFIGKSAMRTVIIYYIHIKHGRTQLINTKKTKHMTCIHNNCVHYPMSSSRWEFLVNSSAVETRTIQQLCHGRIRILELWPGPRFGLNAPLVITPSRTTISTIPPVFTTVGCKFVEAKLCTNLYILRIKYIFYIVRHYNVLVIYCVNM